MLTGKINERWPITINILWDSVRVSVIAMNAFQIRSAHSDNATDIATPRLGGFFGTKIGTRHAAIFCFELPQSADCQGCEPQPALRICGVISRPISIDSGQVFKFETDKTSKLEQLTCSLLPRASVMSYETNLVLGALRHWRLGHWNETMTHQRTAHENVSNWDFWCARKLNDFYVRKRRQRYFDISRSICDFCVLNNLVEIRQ